MPDDEPQISPAERVEKVVPAGDLAVPSDGAGFYTAERGMTVVVESTVTSSPMTVAARTAWRYL